MYGDSRISSLSLNDVFDLFRPSMGLVHRWFSIDHDVRIDEMPGAATMHMPLL